MSRNKEELFRWRLEKILDLDNKFSFMQLLEHHPAEITNCLVKKCAAFGAKKCLLALLNGELCDPPPALDAHANALASAAHCCPDPRIIDLMLNRCHAFPLVNLSCTVSSIHGLPIDFVLFHLSFQDHLFFWGRGDSLIKLIILLCLWNTKPILDSARLLAQYTDSINSVAWTYVKYGALKQFAALLLVAQDKVLAPFDSGLSIRQYLTVEIDSVHDTGSSEQVEYKNMLIDAQRLLDVFERAGDALSLYCSSMQEYVSIEHTVADICEVLKKHEVQVTHNDLLLQLFFKGNRDLLDLDVDKLTEPFDPLFENWLNVRPAGKPTTQYHHGWLPRTKPLWEPISATQQRKMSTRACPARKISKPLEHAPSNHSLKLLAQMTMRLRKGLRYV